MKTEIDDRIDREDRMAYQIETAPQRAAEKRAKERAMKDRFAEKRRMVRLQLAINNCSLGM